MRYAKLATVTTAVVLGLFTGSAGVCEYNEAASGVRRPTEDGQRKLDEQKHADDGDQHHRGDAALRQAARLRPAVLRQQLTTTPLSLAYRHHYDTTHTHTAVTVGGVVSGVRRMNEVNARRARLVLGWVTVFVRVYHLGL